MIGKNAIKVLLLLVLILGGKSLAFAQKDPIEHIWYDGQKLAKIQIYKGNDGNFYGKIIWLKEPDRDGKPKLDINNPDESKRTQPDLGMIIIKGLKKEEDHHYSGATIYDPKSGNTYSCKITEKGKTLDMRGYKGISLLGRTEIWTLVE